jgi:hypothetical protein
MGEFMTATPGERIGGWLIAPLAWLLVALLSASLALLLYTTALITPHAIQTLMSQRAEYCDVVCVVRFRDWHVVLHAVADHRLL